MASNIKGFAVPWGFDPNEAFHNRLHVIRLTESISIMSEAPAFMNVHCLSFAYQWVPIRFREQVHFDAEAIACACGRFQCGDSQPALLQELAILSTCNRTEIYCTAIGGVPTSQVKLTVLKFVAESTQLSVEELAEMGRWFDGLSAAEHLIRVACGLESLVIGEHQILGQVGDSMRTGMALNSMGPILNKLFSYAIQAGRKSRSNAMLTQDAADVASVAVQTAAQRFDSLVGRRVVLLGAGEMAEMALRKLTAIGVKDVIIVNRTISRARELAKPFGGHAFVYEQINDAMRAADILITSTNAPHTLITREMIVQTMRQREDRKLLILDIAVPRDVDTTVDQLPNVERFDIDDLQMACGEAETAPSMLSQFAIVDEIIAAEIDNLLRWYRGVETESVVGELRRKAEAIRKKELERLARLLSQSSETEWSVIERFSEALLNKILHDPTTQLRTMHGTRQAFECADALVTLFGLNKSTDQEIISAEQPLSKNSG